MCAVFKIIVHMQHQLDFCYIVHSCVIENTVAFPPKYRRKVIYGKLKTDRGQILRKLCEEKKVEC